jgi:hypothetical protein
MVNMSASSSGRICCDSAGSSKRQKACCRPRLCRRPALDLMRDQVALKQAVKGVDLPPTAAGRARLLIWPDTGALSLLYYLPLPAATEEHQRRQSTHHTPAELSNLARRLSAQQPPCTHPSAAHLKTSRTSSHFSTLNPSLVSTRQVSRLTDICSGTCACACN